MCVWKEYVYGTLSTCHTMRTSRIFILQYHKYAMNWGPSTRMRKYMCFFFAPKDSASAPLREEQYSIYMSIFPSGKLELCVWYWRLVENKHFRCVEAREREIEIMVACIQFPEVRQRDRALSLTSHNWINIFDSVQYVRCARCNPYHATFARASNFSIIQILL